jgi:hypothetical protein
MLIRRSVIGSNGLVSPTNAALIDGLNSQLGLSPEQELLLHSMLAPFKLLVLRSAQQIPRVGSVASMSRLPKDMCRMLGGMLE